MGGTANHKMGGTANHKMAATRAEVSHNILYVSRPTVP